MKTTLTALLAICLCLPLMGDDAAKKKFEETKAKAEKGDASAQSNLGLMYQYGRGVLEDDKEAVKWFRKAADQGSPGRGANRCGAIMPVQDRPGLSHLIQLKGLNLNTLALFLEENPQVPVTEIGS